LALKPSRLLAGLLATAHVGAAVALGVALADRLGGALAVLLLAGHGAWAVYRHALLCGQRAVVWLEVTDEDTCVAGERGGTMRTCRIDADSYVTPALIVLQLAPLPRGRRICVVLLPDSSSAQALRRLRGRLRLMNAGRADADASL
jgi:toxin CptA